MTRLIQHLISLIFGIPTPESASSNQFQKTHQNGGAVALGQVPGDGDVEVEAVLVHARVGVPHLLAEEAGPDLEGDLHARVRPPVRVQDAGPPATQCVIRNRFCPSETH